MNADDRYKRWVPIAVAFVLCAAAMAFEYALPPRMGDLRFLVAPVFWCILVGLPLVLTPKASWNALAICWVIVFAWPLGVYGARIASSCDAQAVASWSSVLLDITTFLPVNFFANAGYWLGLLFAITAGSMLIGRASRWTRPTAIWSLQFILTVPLIYWIAEAVWRSAGVHPVPGYCMGL